MAERIGVSVSSIKHNLGSVRELLGEHGVTLVSVPQKGMYVEATEEQRTELENVLLWFSNHNPVSEGFRRDYIFQTVFRYQGNYTVQLLAEELYVSRNVISRDLKYLNSFLEPFHVKIATRKNSGIVIEGHEFEIRQALIMYNNQKWWNEDYLEPPAELDVRLSNRAWTFLSNFYPECAEDLWDIQDALLSMEEQTETVFTDVAFGRLMEYLMITRERLKLGKCILSYVEEERLKVSGKYLKAAEIFLSLYIDENDECWKYERRFLAARLFVADTVHITQRKSGYHDEIEQYLEEVRNVAGRYYSIGDEELIANVEDLITRMRYRKNYRIYDWTNLSKGVKVRLAGLYAVCMMQIYILERPTGLKFQEDDIARIVLLIHNFMKKKRKEAVYVTAANEEVSYYNLAKLKEELPYIHFKEVIHYRDFRLENYERALVVSTVALKEEAPNLVCITKHVTDADVDIIKKRLVKNGLHKGEILGRVFREELVYDIVAKSKADALEKISDRLMEQGCVEEGFLKEALDREKVLATSIGNGVAIPHVYKNHVLESSVAIARLKNNVRWAEEEWTDLIFLFAIGDEEAEDIKKIFSHMYNVLKEEELIGQIREAGSPKEIRQLVLNCEYGAHHSNKTI